MVVEVLPHLFGAALRLTRNRPDAEDLVAEAVTRGWEHLDTLHDRTRLRGWLFRILTNAFLSVKRTARRRGVHVARPGREACPAERPWNLIDAAAMILRQSRHASRRRSARPAVQAAR